MFDDLTRYLLLQDYSTRIVVLAMACLGCTSGIAGSLMLLRKRALLSDAISHASLPGVACAYLVGVVLGWDPKSFSLLISGAVISGLIGSGLILLLKHTTRLREDAILGLVLSVFYGIGIALLGMIQHMKNGHAAGLEGFIFGKAATMIQRDLIWIASVCLVVGLVTLLLFKEFRLICFDQGFASSQGFPVVLLDFLLNTLIVAVTMVGIQAVGAILMVAMLVIPPAAARFWTNSMSRMTIVSAGIGAASGYIGCLASAVAPKLPSGPIVVIVAAVFFTTSMLVGPEHGLLVRAYRRRKLEQQIARDHLLRSLFELLEADLGTAAMASFSDRFVSLDRLRSVRSWAGGGLTQAAAQCVGEGLCRREGPQIGLSETGWNIASQVAREHRLWEHYLIHHAAHDSMSVDRQADLIEHVFDPEVIRQLEESLRERLAEGEMPVSPHPEIPGDSS